VKTTTVENGPYFVAMKRMIKAAGQRAAEGDTKDLLGLLQLHQILDDATITALCGLKTAGATWQDIADTLGVSKQVAVMRWAKKVHARQERSDAGS